jgi:hypothetical protein
MMNAVKEAGTVLWGNLGWRGENFLERIEQILETKLE